MKRVQMSVLGLCGLLVCGEAAAQALPQAVRLENGRIRVVEITHPPGAARARHVRAHDQIIVFLDDCRYERTDPETGEKAVRERKAGEVIWHGRGEAAPELVNVGSKPYRTLVIELKE
ncbi:MAG: hypothetical protein K6T59_04640 [Bryobacteraceae bacterium]|jgi:hypothetical protein|nr:hypothetical protein [Bryobacteraceae bacterium]